MSNLYLLVESYCRGTLLYNSLISRDKCGNKGIVGIIEIIMFITEGGI
jgi:hypothetical protein